MGQWTEVLNEAGKNENKWRMDDIKFVQNYIKFMIS